MVELLQGVAGLQGVEAQPVQGLATVVDTKGVRDWLLGYLDSSAKRAYDVSKVGIWPNVEASDAAYGLNKKAIDPQEAGIKAASAKANFEIHTADLADQADEMTAVIDDLTTSGPIRRLVPKAGVTEHTAELMTKIQDAMLAEKNIREEIRTFEGRFVRHLYGGMKICRTYERTYITERVEVPVRVPQPVLDMYGQPMLDPMTGMPATQMVGVYDDEALLNRGFDPEAILNGTALRSALAEDGYTFVGIADQRQDGSSDNLLCNKCKPIERSYVYIKAMDTRRIAFSDLSRPIQDQPSVHEYHYMSETQLKKAGFDPASIKDAGKKITNTNQQAPGETLKEPTATFGDDQCRYEVVETWSEIPWRSGIEQGKFDEQQLRAFAIEQGFPVEEVKYESQKWCSFHSGGGVLLRIYPNYMGGEFKDEYPYEMDSFIHSDGKLAGQSLLTRLSNPCANKLAFLNLTGVGVKKNLYQPMFVSSRLDLSDDELSEMQEAGCVKRIDSQLGIEQDIYIHQQPDVSGSGMKMVSYFDQSVRQLGVPAVLAGEGSADTATQASINNRRGQTIVTDSVRRMIGVIARAYKKHLKVVVDSFTTSRFIDIVGEDGSTLTQQWVMPNELTDKLEVEPMVSLDQGDKQRLAQTLMGMANILATIFPEGAKEVALLAMRYSGISETDIAKIEGAGGSLTNVYQEIESMVHDPELKVEVRMDDPHPVCIQMAQTAIMEIQKRAMDLGIEPQDTSNLDEYIQVHTAMQQHIEMQAQMQAMLTGEDPNAGPKGKPKQAPKGGEPDSEEGDARQGAQFDSPGNKGPMSAAGLTGQGSVGL